MVIFCWGSSFNLCPWASLILSWIWSLSIFPRSEFLFLDILVLVAPPRKPFFGSLIPLLETGIEPQNSITDALLPVNQCVLLYRSAPTHTLSSDPEPYTFLLSHLLGHPWHLILTAGLEHHFLPASSLNIILYGFNFLLGLGSWLYNSSPFPPLVQWL